MDQVFSVKGGGDSPALATAPESDPHIISMVRQGVTEAFDVLYERHLKIAQYVARAQTDNPSDADDVVAEAFATVFQLLTEGKGPNEFFRSYLLTVVRRTAHDRNRKARRMPTADDAVLDSAVLDSDPVLNRLESSIMAKAFKSLPERWQAVLWHLDIEGLKPAAAAPLVGLTPNGVSSLALRAREGLRQAYLQQHISQTVGDGCEEYASQLGKYARGGLKRTSAERVKAHLDGCAKCTALLMELNDVQGGMRAILFPLVTGIAFSPAAIASLGSAAATGGTVVARSVSQMWKLAAAIVVGVLALVGVVGWLLQPTAATESPAAGDAGEKVPPVHATSTPAATPSPTAMPSPATTPGLEASGAAPNIAQTPTAEAPVVTAPQPTAVGLPPAQGKRSAVVVDSGTVSSTTTPAASGSPAPVTQTVDATFTSTAGPGAGQRDVSVEFSLDGEGSPTMGEAVFTLPDQATFVAERTAAPSGWTCASAASELRQVRCVTSSMAAHDLAFRLGVAMPDGSGSGMVTYQFGGQGIANTSFANAYH